MHYYSIQPAAPSLSFAQLQLISVRPIFDSIRELDAEDAISTGKRLE